MKINCIYNTLKISGYDSLYHFFTDLGDFCCKSHSEIQLLFHDALSGYLLLTLLSLKQSGGPFSGPVYMLVKAEWK